MPMKSELPKSSDHLHRPLYVPELLVNALNQDADRPMRNLLDGPTLTVGQVRDAASQFAQALEHLGVARGKRVGLLSANRPEVLHLSNAVQLTAAIYVPMHPLGGLQDHCEHPAVSQVAVIGVPHGK